MDPTHQKTILSVTQGHAPREAQESPLEYGKSLEVLLTFISFFLFLPWGVFYNVQSINTYM